MGSYIIHRINWCSTLHFCFLRPILQFLMLAKTTTSNNKASVSYKPTACLSSVQFRNSYMTSNLFAYSFQAWIKNQCVMLSTSNSYPQQAFSSFGQAVSKVFWLPTHFLSPFLLKFFIHSNSSQAFSNRTSDSGHHPCCTT